MTTIKSYTDLEQSKVLSKILPLESADMCYMYLGTEDKKYQDIPICAPAMEGDLCAWSLAALLSVLPPYLYEWEKGIDFNLYPSVAKKRWWCAGYISQDLNPENKDKFTLITHADNPIDACYEMILKLNELKML